MAVKKIYVRPGTMLDIHVVKNQDEPLNSSGWRYQNRPEKVLVTIHGARTVEIHGHDIDTYGGRQNGHIMPKTSNA